jgi:cellulose synthase/poly-beta-1,6-N-acetylglucosamine synthase-like glycosyltransferase
MIGLRKKLFFIKLGLKQVAIERSVSRAFNYFSLKVSSTCNYINQKWLKPHSAKLAFAWVGVFYLITIAVIALSDRNASVQTPEWLSTLRFVLFCFLVPFLFKYLLQIVASLLYSLNWFNKYKHQRRPKPLVSVLIPAWNEEVGIIKTLESVLDTYYEKLEVIIINDGSTDNTHQLVDSFLEAYEKNHFLKPNVKYLDIENSGKAKALNKALKIATGEIVFTIDADSIMDRDTITNIVKRFDDPAVAAVAGHVIIGNKKKPLEIIQQLEYLCGFFFKRADSLFNSVYIIGGAAAAYRKSVLEKLGGFDHEIITEDIELSTRMLAHGYKTKYASDAVVYTEGPDEFKGLCNQRLRWKFCRLLTFFKYRKLFFSFDKKHNPYLSFLLLPLAVYADLLLLFQGVLVSLFFTYTIFSGDYFPVAMVILFSSSLILCQMLLDSKTRFHSNLLPFVPIAWLIFYVVEVVELQALFRSLKKLLKKQSIKWQNWQRRGLAG